MLRTIDRKLRRLVILENLYEYKHVLPQSVDEVDLGNTGAEFALLRNIEDVERYIWESGESEASQIRKLLADGEVVGVIHEGGRICGRLSIRKTGWFSISSRRRVRHLGPNEGYVHFVRTSEFARGRGYQAIMYRHFLNKMTLGELEFVTSTVDVGNVPSIKSTERAGGVKVAKLRSIGLLGGRIGFSVRLRLDATKLVPMATENNQEHANE